MAAEGVGQCIQRVLLIMQVEEEFRKFKDPFRVSLGVLKALRELDQVAVVCVDGNWVVSSFQVASLVL